MDILKARCELQGMSAGNLFNLALNQKMSGCVMAGKPCCFHLQYKGCSFCASEILRNGCQLERLEQVDQRCRREEEVSSSLPFPHEMEPKFFSSWEKGAEFKVYHRDRHTRLTVLLGMITERRKEERGNNLGDLLDKAVRQYSNDVKDPSTIFLLG
jgi:hypothetical protein